MNRLNMPNPSHNEGGQAAHPRILKKTAIRQIGRDRPIYIRPARRLATPESVHTIQAGQMQETFVYPLQLVNDHLVIDIDGYYALIDSGSPMTIGRAGDSLALAGQRWDIPEQVGTWNTAALGREVGCRLDVLLGMDIMSQYFTLIDTREGTATFSFTSLLENCTSQPVQHLYTRQWGLSPTVAVKNWGEVIELADADHLAEPLAPDHPRLIVDCGSKLLYVPRRDALQYPVNGSEPDFYIGLDGWEHPTHRRVVITPAGEELVCQAGYLPETLEGMTMHDGICGVLGIDLFKQYLVEIAPDGQNGIQMSIAHPEIAAD